MVNGLHLYSVQADHSKSFRVYAGSDPCCPTVMVTKSHVFDKSVCPVPSSGVVGRTMPEFTCCNWTWTWYLMWFRALWRNFRCVCIKTEWKYWKNFGQLCKRKMHICVLRRSDRSSGSTKWNKEVPHIHISSAQWGVELLIQGSI